MGYCRSRRTSGRGRRGERGSKDARLRSRGGLGLASVRGPRARRCPSSRRWRCRRRRRISTCLTRRYGPRGERARASRTVTDATQTGCIQPGIQIEPISIGTSALHASYQRRALILAGARIRRLRPRSGHALRRSPCRRPCLRRRRRARGRGWRSSRHRRRGLRVIHPTLPPGRSQTP